MKFTSIVAVLGAAFFASAITITNPSSNISQVPIWPETLLEWTWAMGDPDVVDIVIQYHFSNDTTVHALTWKKNVSATGGSVTVPWIPLGLEVGTVCELGLTHVDDDKAAYDHTNEFTLVKANGTPSVGSSFTPLVTGVSVSPIGSNVSATVFTTISSTSTVTVITDTGISTATMSSAGTANTSGSITTVHKTISTTTQTISLTENFSAATMATASALASSGIAATAAGPSTVYVSVTVTETGACGGRDVTTLSNSTTTASLPATTPPFGTGNITSVGTTGSITIPSSASLTSTASFTPQSGAANSMHGMLLTAKLTTPTAATTTTTGVYLAALTIFAWLASGVVIGSGSGIYI